MTPQAGSSVVAVLFTDLVGSTDLMVGLGDIAFDKLRGEHFTRLAKVANPQPSDPQQWGRATRLLRGQRG
jgi:hypothetical protein